MDFLEELKGKIGESKKGFDEAVGSGARLRIIGALKDLVQKAVYFAEQFADSVKDYDINFVVMTGAEKHELVLTATLDAVAEKLNKAFDIPFISEELEGKLIKGLINWLIKASVSYFNKNGWAI